MMWNAERSRYYLLVFAGSIAAGLTVLFRDFIFSDEMLFSADIIAGGVFFRLFLRQTLVDFGYIPLWNPYYYCGMPFIEAIHGAVFYPATFLEVTGNIFRSIGWSLIAHYFLAGIFTYLAARQLRLSKLAATVAGVTYMFSPGLLGWALSGHDGKIYAATLFPLAILFLFRLFDRRRLLNSALLGAVLGLIILTPHLQMAYYIFGIITLIAIVKLIEQFIRQRHFRALASPLLAVLFAILLGLTISAVQWIPSASYIFTDSPRAEQERGYDWATSFSMHEEEAVAIVLPEFCGLDSKFDAMTYWGKNAFKDNSESVGLIPVILALVGICLRGRRMKYLWGLLTIMVLMYALGAHTPLMKILLAIFPHMDAMRQPSGAMFIFIFSIGIMAAIGIDNVRQAVTDNQKRRRRLAVGLLIAVPVPVFLAAMSFSVRGRDVILWWARLFHESLLQVGNNTPPLLDQAMRNLPLLSSALWWTLLATVITSSVLLVVIVKRKYLGVLWVLPFLIWGLNHNFNHRLICTFDQSEIFYSNPVVNLLKREQSLDRAISYKINGFTVELELACHEIYSSLGHHDKKLTSYYDFIGNPFKTAILNADVANLSAMRYVITQQGFPLPVDTLGPIPLDTVLATSKYTVFENHNCLPRVFLAGQFRVVPDRTEIVGLVHAGADDFASVVYLEEDPAQEILPDSSGRSEAEIIFYSPDSLTVRVHAETPQLLVLSDTFYEPWQAFVDGRPEKIYRAYGTFRAVPVPAGDSEVAFRYESPIITRSMYVSGLGGIILIVLLFVGLRRSRGDHSRNWLRQ